MKDCEARIVINLLTKRIRQLQQEIQKLQAPHVKECRCSACTDPRFRANYFAIKIEGVNWWEDE